MSSQSVSQSVSQYASAPVRSVSVSRDVWSGPHISPLLGDHTGHQSSVITEREREREREGGRVWSHLHLPILPQYVYILGPYAGSQNIEIISDPYRESN